MNKPASPQADKPPRYATIEAPGQTRKLPEKPTTPKKPEVKQ